MCETTRNILVRGRQKDTGQHINTTTRKTNNNKTDIHMGMYDYKKTLLLFVVCVKKRVCLKIRHTSF